MSDLVGKTSGRRFRALFQAPNDTVRKAGFLGFMRHPHQEPFTSSRHLDVIVDDIGDSRNEDASFLRISAAATISVQYVFGTFAVLLTIYGRAWELKPRRYYIGSTYVVAAIASKEPFLWVKPIVFRPITCAQGHCQLIAAPRNRDTSEMPVSPNDATSG